jgi:hypothetical protein
MRSSDSTLHNTARLHRVEAATVEHHDKKMRIVDIRLGSTYQSDLVLRDSDRRTLTARSNQEVVKGNQTTHN